jgi:putative SOS response-associated peptidase YedK
LVPFWAKDISIGARMINARVETLASKPAFKAALKHRRCLIPANGFYEWSGKAGSNQVGNNRKECMKPLEDATQSVSRENYPKKG